MKNKITQIYFSPGGTTAAVSQELAALLARSSDTADLLQAPPTSAVCFSRDELVLVSVPVFSGRIPSVCVDMLKRFSGSGTSAIAVVVYGNREYDDALLELTDILEAQGFTVMGAAAFVARHSIFPAVEEKRPDGADRAVMASFARTCLDRLQGEPVKVSVKGGRPYRKGGSLPIKPSAGAGCTSCGVCARVCPVQAIDKASPKKTDKSRCISCTACIYACPAKARAFRGPVYKLAGSFFAKKYSSRKEPELF